MATLNRFFKKILSLFLISLIKIYQWALRPLLGYHCRFFPSCSEYMLEAIRTYGIVRGSYWGVKRLMRCHPFCQGGIDLLPVEKNFHD